MITNSSQKIRPVKLDDTNAINSLLASAWFAERSQLGWKWLFEENPAQGAHSPGFVVQNQNEEVVGFIGCCVKDFSYKGETLKAVSGHSHIAHPNQLHVGIKLIREVIKQNVGFGSYTLNNNEIAARIYPRIKNNISLFEPTANIVLQWITNPGLYISSGLRRRYHIMSNFRNSRNGKERFGKAPPLAASAFKLPNNTNLIADHTECSNEIDAFWAKLHNSDNLYTNRSSKTINWVLSNPDFKIPPIFITFEGSEGIEGWLLAVISKETEISAPILSVIDLISLPDKEAQTFPDLIRAAKSIATELNLEKLQIPHVRQATINALVPELSAANIKNGPYNHAHGTFHSGYSSENLRNIWFQTPLDGDYAFCLRPFPLDN